MKTWGIEACEPHIPHNDYLKGYWYIDKIDIFYIEITQKGIEFYRDEKRIRSTERLTEWELEYLKIIEHWGDSLLHDYFHFFPHEIESYKFLEQLENRGLVKIEWRSISRNSTLHYILTAKAKDYLWLQNHT
jgi:hypothetical protein